jgi:hypothetical protein
MVIVGPWVPTVEGSRCQPHEVEPNVVDARTDARIGWVAHDLRGHHVVIIVAVASDVEPLR